MNDSIDSGRATMLGTLFVGGCAVAVAGVVLDPRRGWGGLLIAALFGISLALGGAIFVALHGVVGARWWRPLRELPIRLAQTLVVPAIGLAVALVLGLRDLYPWANGAEVAASPLLQEKSAWFQPSFFLARAVVVVLIWILAIGGLRERLAELIRTESSAARRRFVKASAIFILLFAPTISIGWWDWSMSLEPEWYSTMWSVYAFAGAFVGAIAVVILLALELDRRGLLPEPLAPRHLHDLGKLLFAFSAFWAYIWFCQYLLVWYADLPEEATWFARRLHGGWSMMFVFDFVLSFAIPFLALVSARTKTNPQLLAQVAIVVLAGHWLDTWLMVAPDLGPLDGFPWWAIGATVAIGSAMWIRLERIGGVVVDAPAPAPRPPLLARSPGE